MASQVDDRFQRPEDLVRDLLPLASALGVPTRTGLWAEMPAPRFSWAEHRGWILALSLLAIIGVVASLPPQEVAPLPVTSIPPSPPLLNSVSPSLETPSDKNAPPALYDQLPQSKPPPVPPAAPPEVAPLPRPSGVLAGTRLGARGLTTITPVELSHNSQSASQTPPRPSSLSHNPAPTPKNAEENRFWASTSGFDGTSGVPKSYATLEAACLDAPDNSTIELRFDGESPVQIPIRIEGKSLRIRALAGRRPVLRFETLGPIGQPVTSNMISVINGSLEIFDVDIVFRVPNGRSVDSWSIFSLEYAKQVMLRGVSVTLENSNRQQPGTLFEIKPPSGTLMERMMPEGISARPSPPPRKKPASCP